MAESVDAKPPIELGPFFEAPRSEQQQRHDGVQRNARPQQHARRCCPTVPRYARYSAMQRVVDQHRPEAGRAAIAALSGPASTPIPARATRCRSIGPAASPHRRASAPSSSLTTIAGSIISARPVADLHDRGEDEDLPQCVVARFAHRH